MPQPEEDSVPGVPEWVVTYGDMMSLLLTFFIMLVSMSQLKEDGKVQAMLDSIREAFGPTSGSSGVLGKSLQKNSSYTKPSSRSSRMAGGTEQVATESKGRSGGHRTAKRISHGTVMTLGGPTLFARFEATLSDALKKNLDILSHTLGGKPNRVMVRGHAYSEDSEDLPPNSKFRDQLGLSFARAHAVAKYLVEKGIDRRRLLVSAAGDTEPRTTTHQEGGQKLNRRVDVFLIDSYIAHSKTPDSRKR
jgi:chemotaxis protein MotB